MDWKLIYVDFILVYPKPQHLAGGFPKTVYFRTCLFFFIHFLGSPARPSLLSCKRWATGATGAGLPPTACRTSDWRPGPGRGAASATRRGAPCPSWSLSSGYLDLIGGWYMVSIWIIYSYGSSFSIYSYSIYKPYENCSYRYQKLLYLWLNHLK